MLVLEFIEVLGTVWGKTLIWLLGTYSVVRFIRSATIKLEANNDLSKPGKIVLIGHIKFMADEKSNHWVNDFGRVTDFIYGDKLFSVRAFFLSAILSTTLYFYISVLMIDGAPLSSASFSDDVSVGGYYILFIFPIINIIYDFFSLVLTRLVLRINKISYLAKVVTDIIISLIIIIIGIKCAQFGMLALGEYLYNAEIVVVSEDEFKVVKYSSDKFRYDVIIKDAQVLVSDQQLVVDQALGLDERTKNEMTEELNKAKMALTISLIGAYSFFEREYISEVTMSSIVSVIITSLSTSVWLWLHGLSSLTIKFLRKITRNFRLLNIDEKPVQVAGIITCAYIVSISFLLYFFMLILS